MSILWDFLNKIFESHSASKPKLDLSPITRKVNSIVIHHSLTDDGAVKNWDAIKQYHMKTNKWDDIGYHYGIEYIGEEATVMIGRPLETPGAHVKGFNRKSIGVCVVGNFDYTNPPVDKWDLCVDLVRLLCKTYNISYDAVLGHREAQIILGERYPKTCPGTNWNMEKFRRAL